MTDTVSTPTSMRPQGMLCPVCKVALALADRQGIEIDYCPQCRGIWLDRGELDKIIERNEAYEAAKTVASAPAPIVAPAPAYPPASPWGGYDDGHRRDRHGDGHHGERQGGYRPGGFLGGLFRH